jgi:hypothetical protein
MTLSIEQAQAIEQGRALPLTINDTPCVVLRKDIYERLSGKAYDDSDWTDDEMEALANEMFAGLNASEGIA